MKFSVIIPLYNGEKFIANTLQSIRGQTFRDFEVIIVNDGSTDNGYKIAMDYDLKGIPKLLMKQKNCGLGSARNLAIADASGDYIALLDQDDIWYPTKLEEVSKCDAEVIYHAQHVRRSGIVQRTLRSKNYPNIFEKLFWRNELSGSTVCFKRELIKEIGGFDETLTFVEDYDLWLRMAEVATTFHYIDKVLGERLIHGGNASNQIGVMKRNELRILKKYFGNWNYFKIARLCLLNLKYLKQYLWNYLTLT